MVTWYLLITPASQSETGILCGGDVNLYNHTQDQTKAVIKAEYKNFNPFRQQHKTWSNINRKIICRKSFSSQSPDLMCRNKSVLLPECCCESGYWAPHESTRVSFCHSGSRLGCVSVQCCYTDTLLNCAQIYWNLWGSRRTSGSTSGSQAETVRTVGWWSRTAWWSVNSPTRTNLWEDETL